MESVQLSGPLFDKADYYGAYELKDMAEVRSTIPRADELNWLFVGTSGVHGSYWTLDSFGVSEDDGWSPTHFTVLVVQPRTVRTFYGDLEVDVEDVAWLRERVAETVAAIGRQAAPNLAT